MFIFFSLLNTKIYNSKEDHHKEVMKPCISQPEQQTGWIDAFVGYKTVDKQSINTVKNSYV